MSTTAQQLSTLREMYAKGVLTFEQNGEKITFVSGLEMRVRIKALEDQLARESGGAAKTGITYPSFNKGFGA